MLPCPYIVYTIIVIIIYIVYIIYYIYYILIFPLQSQTKSKADLIISFSQKSRLLPMLTRLHA